MHEHLTTPISGGEDSDAPQFLRSVNPDTVAAVATAPRKRYTVKHSQAEIPTGQEIPATAEASPAPDPLADATRLVSLGNGSAIYQLPPTFPSDDGRNGAGLAIVSANRTARYICGRRAVLTVERVATPDTGSGLWTRYHLTATNPDTGEAVSLVIPGDPEEARKTAAWAPLASIGATAPVGKTQHEYATETLPELTLHHGAIRQTLVRQLGWRDDPIDGLVWILSNGTISADGIRYEAAARTLADVTGTQGYILPPAREDGTPDLPDVLDAGVLLDYLAIFSGDPTSEAGMIPAAILGTLARVGLPLPVTPGEVAGRLNYMLFIGGQTNGQKSAAVNWALALFSGSGFTHETGTVLVDSELNDSGIGAGYIRNQRAYHGITDIDYNANETNTAVFERQMKTLQARMKGARSNAAGTTVGTQSGGYRQRPPASGVLVATGERDPRPFFVSIDDESTLAALAYWNAGSHDDRERARRLAVSKTVGTKAGHLHGLGIAWYRWLATLGREEVAASLAEYRTAAEEEIDRRTRDLGATGTLPRIMRAATETVAGLSLFADFLAACDVATGTAPHALRTVAQGEHVAGILADMALAIIDNRITDAARISQEFSDERGGTTVEESTAGYFVRLVRRALANGRAHITGAGNTDEPTSVPDGYSWKDAGWRSLGGDTWRADGLHIGNLTPDGVHIAFFADRLYEMYFSEAQREKRRGVSTQALWTALERAGIAEPIRNARRTRNYRVPGNGTTSRLFLPVGAFFPVGMDDDEPEPTAPGSPTSPSTARHDAQPIQPHEVTRAARQEPQRAQGARCMECGRDIPTGYCFCSETCRSIAAAKIHVGHTIPGPRTVAPLTAEPEPDMRQPELTATVNDPAPVAVRENRTAPQPEKTPAAPAPASQVTKRPARKPYGFRAVAFVNPHTGELVADGPSERDQPTAGTVRKSAGLADILTVLPEHISRVYICGGRPGSGTTTDLYAWMQADLANGWQVGRMTLDADNPVIRVHRDGREVDVRLIETWFECDDPGRARFAFVELRRMLRRKPAFRDAQVLTTPAMTGMQLWDAVTAGHDYPTLPQDVQSLVRSTTGQGRIECCTLPDLETVPGFAYLDGRFMYAALTSELAYGLESHDTEPTFAGFTPARYRVRFTIPQDWQHVGLLPVKHEDGESWTYPATPGETHETWCDGAEYMLAQRHGWQLDILERLVFGRAPKGTPDPLETWTRNLISVRELVDSEAGSFALHEDVADLVKGAVRSILLFTIGSFASRPRTETQVVPLQKEGPAKEPEGTIGQPRIDYARRVMFCQVELPQSAWRLAHAHPEWAAQVWARARARLLWHEVRMPNGEKVPTGALAVPRADVLGMRTDALYLASNPGWPDTGRIGVFRLKGEICEPVPAPHSLDDLNPLRDRAESEHER